MDALSTILFVVNVVCAAWMLSLGIMPSAAFNVAAALVLVINARGRC